MSEQIKSVITCDLDGKLETFNEGAATLFGYNQEEVVNKMRVSDFSDGQVVLGHVVGSFGNVGGGQDPQRGRRAGPRSAARSTAARWAGTTTRAVRTGSATSAVGRSGDVGGGHVRRRRQWAVPATWMLGGFGNQGGRRLRHRGPWAGSAAWAEGRERNASAGQIR